MGGAAMMSEVERLRKINSELVCSHNDLLVVIVNLESLVEERNTTIASLERKLNTLEGGFS
jgi:hypothetical protein